MFGMGTGVTLSLRPPKIYGTLCELHRTALETAHPAEPAFRRPVSLADKIYGTLCIRSTGLMVDRIYNCIKKSDNRREEAREQSVDRSNRNQDFKQEK